MVSTILQWKMWKFLLHLVQLPLDHLKDIGVHNTTGEWEGIINPIFSSFAVDVWNLWLVSADRLVTQAWTSVMTFSNVFCKCLYAKSKYGNYMCLSCGWKMKHIRVQIIGNFISPYISSRDTMFNPKFFLVWE